MFELYVSDSPATPKQVLQSIADDFKIQGLTYDSAAARLGYKSKSGLARMMSGDEYPSEKMTFRMSQIFGYDSEFLLHGKGALYPTKPDQETLRAELDKMPMRRFNTSAKELLLLSDIIQNSNIQFALLSFIKNDKAMFYEFLEKYSKEQGIYENVKDYIEQVRTATMLQRERVMEMNRERMNRLNQEHSPKDE